MEKMFDRMHTERGLCPLSSPEIRGKCASVAWKPWLLHHLAGHDSQTHR